MRGIPEPNVEHTKRSWGKCRVPLVKVPIECKHRHDSKHLDGLSKADLIHEESGPTVEGVEKHLQDTHKLMSLET